MIETEGIRDNQLMAVDKWRFLFEELSGARSIHWPTARAPQPPTPKNSIFNYTFIIITNTIMH
jgi:hypothetical protein